MEVYMKDIKLGLVNGLLYYDYEELIKVFLDELNISYISSGKTTKETIESGKRLLVDESCLSLKIYFGHMKELMDKCDYVITIRCPSIRRDEMMCTNFYALYDLANNLFPNRIIELNIDLKKRITLKRAFIKLGKKLNINRCKTARAFDKAFKRYVEKRNEETEKQLNILNSTAKKILLVGHSYNLLDDYIMSDIKNILKDNNIEVILSNRFFDEENEEYQSISKDLYWSKNIDSLNAIMRCKDKIDGLILISAFPCGPDSLVNEMIRHKLDLPILNLVIDETNDNGGIITRIESFIDIINMQEDVYDQN